jgi:hypothetical protein
VAASMRGTATVGLERIGDHRRALRALRRSRGIRETPRELCQRLPEPWVAEVTGWVDGIRPLLVRLRARRDYTRANATGDRGVVDYYHLTPGRLYQVCEVRSLSGATLRFAVARDGRVVYLSEEEVRGWQP